jgi:Stress responsive A/B Barrel Domain
MPMLTHVVLLQPRSEATPEDINAALKGIEDLQQHIPEILDLQIGPSLSVEDKQRGYTYGFVMHFAGKEQLDRYAVNPIHITAGLELIRVFRNIIDFDII